MRYISLELVGFNRMMLNQVQRFTITPTERVQLILGTNGSGKSSLMGELTPLPPNPADYKKDGSKTIKISHLGHVYTLRSWFQPSPKHSFKRGDDEELNPGGTGTAQKELVRQIFGITPETHELATGQERFHSMTPARRREWFTRLSDVSYDYALKVYNELRSKHRDVQGALKLSKQRLVTEVAKVISQEEEDKLRADVKVLHEELTKLQGIRAPLTRSVHSCEQNHEAVMEELLQLSTQLHRMRRVMLDSAKYESPEQIDAMIDQDRHAVTAQETLINNAVAVHSKLTEDVEILKRTGADGVASLQAKIHEARERQFSILHLRKLKLEGFDPMVAANAVESVYDTLQAVFLTIPQNDDGQYSSARAKEDEAKLLVQRDLRTRKLGEIAEVNARKTHMEAHKNNAANECPKCRHRWVNGYSDEKLAQFAEQLEKRTEELKEIDNTISGLETHLKEFEGYRSLYMDFVRCTKNWPVLKPFWDHLLERNLVVTAPRSAMTALDQLRSDMQFELQAHAVEKEIENYKILIQQAEKVGDASLTDSINKLAAVTSQIEEMTHQLTIIKRRLNEHTQFRRQLTEFANLRSEVTRLQQRSGELANETVEMMRRETIQQCIENLQVSLAKKTEALSAVSLQKGIIKDLERTIAQLIVREEAAKIVVKELSPTDGLIAEGMYGFIRNFVAQMNSLIRKIWAYPLQVLDCGMASEGAAELDYKFPMMVSAKTNVVPDVSKGSSGMREIVDLAFQLVALRYLGLGETPLFLDEFGASLDEEHRTAATMTIKTLMDSLQFSQLYMVSHYESGYGSFTSAQTCVLDARNITVPSVYNQHVTIE